MALWWMWKSADLVHWKRVPLGPPFDSYGVDDYRLNSGMLRDAIHVPDVGWVVTGNLPPSTTASFYPILGVSGILLSPSRLNRSSAETVTWSLANKVLGSVYEQFDCEVNAVAWSPTDGTFVAVGRNIVSNARAVSYYPYEVFGITAGTIYSLDGQNWIASTAPGVSGINAYYTAVYYSTGKCVIWDGSQFLVGGHSGSHHYCLAYSTDGGDIWYAIDTPFVAPQGPGDWLYGYGTSTSLEQPNVGSILGLGYNGTQYVAVGSGPPDPVGNRLSTAARLEGSSFSPWQLINNGSGNNSVEFGSFGAGYSESGTGKSAKITVLQQTLQSTMEIEIGNGVIPVAIPAPMFAGFLGWSVIGVWINNPTQNWGTTAQLHLYGYTATGTKTELAVTHPLTGATQNWGMHHILTGNFVPPETYTHIGMKLVISLDSYYRNLADTDPSYRMQPGLTYYVSAAEYYLIPYGYPGQPMLCTSTNGTAWTERSVAFDGNVPACVEWCPASGGRWVVGTENGGLAAYYGGTPLERELWPGAPSVPGRDEVIYTSSDGVTWTPRSSPLNGPWTSVRAIKWNAALNQLVAAGWRYSFPDGGYDLQPVIATSPDGITWTERALGSNPNYHGWLTGIGVGPDGETLVLGNGGMVDPARGGWSVG